MLGQHIFCLLYPKIKGQLYKIAIGKLRHYAMSLKQMLKYFVLLKLEEIFCKAGVLITHSVLVLNLKEILLTINSHGRSRRKIKEFGS